MCSFSLKLCPSLQASSILKRGSGEAREIEIRGGGGSAEENFKFYVTFVGSMWPKFEVCVVRGWRRYESMKYEVIHPDSSTLYSTLTINCRRLLYVIY